MHGEQPKVHVWRALREPVLAGVIWSLTALGCLALRDVLGGVILVWVPSGVAVAAFYVVRKRHWAVLALAMLPIQAATIWSAGIPLAEATVYSISSVVQSAIIASLSTMALGGRSQVPRKFRQLSGAFAAAIAGCLAGALIAIPFRAEQTVGEFSWWFMANVLAVIILSPILLNLVRKLTARGNDVARSGVEPSLYPLLLACAGLAMLALQVSQVTLMPLLVAAMVMIAVRYGQVASLLVVLIYAVCATALSIFAGSPMPYLGVGAGEATLVFQTWMLTMLATALPIAAALMKRQQLQRELIARNREMRESLTLFDLAEETASIGRWRLDLVTGEQDWSPKMLEMNGLPRSLAPDPGDLRHRLPDGGSEVFGQIARNKETLGTYTFTYRIRPTNELERGLRMTMLNEFDQRGKRTAVFGVAMDVTEQVRREEALDTARSRAMRLATEAQKLANTDPLTGLPNRRCTFSKLDSMSLVAENCGSPLSAMLFDIDYFKSVNDTYGHQVGDEVIQRVAEIARAQSRKGDVVGRIGGEEFVWLIAGTQESAARLLAERLRQAVEQGFTGTRLPSVTISVGLAYFRPGDDCESLLARADAALYEAKGSGRNRVQRAA